MSRLTDLIRQAKGKDPALGRDLEAEFAALSSRRRFGLNFERHQPEAVELPGRQPRKGDKVRVLPPRGSSIAGDRRLWKVVGVAPVDGAELAHLQVMDDDGEVLESTDHPIGDVVVVAEFRDPIYPGLLSTGRVERGGNKPFHTVINAENFHALQTLQYTHQEAVDFIYIDPPYNTGQDAWIYNDRYVDNDDHFRHSKWLAFMERRLALAKQLLTATGVIFVSIGDDQQHRLRLLMDQVFGEQNFVANLVWDGGTKSYANLVSSGQDYMLVYANDLAAMSDNNIQWRESKPGLEDVLAKGAELFTTHEGDAVTATVDFRKWLSKSGLAPGIRRFNTIEPDTGRVFNADRDLGAPEFRPNRSRRPLVHPDTGKECPVPVNGWRLSDAEMDARISAGRVAFGDDEKKIPREKSYLDEASSQIATAVFQKDRNSASSHLAHILGSKRFPFPKDHTVLMRWIRLAAPKDAVILDFFAGSGSTAEAVMRLNAEDDGARQCILVTNNEVGKKEAAAMRKQGIRKGDPEWEARGVSQYVTIPRLTTVATGTRPDVSKYPNSVGANVEFFDLIYESPWRVGRGRAFNAVAPLLWMRAGSEGRRIDEIPAAGWDVADVYGVIADLDETGPFLEAVTCSKRVRVVFIVTDDDRAFQSVCAVLPERVEPVRLYESYLRNFEIKGRD
ncbi:MAG: site-specific DNA-methyltransferase [Micrococcaceae bacterium]